MKLIKQFMCFLAILSTCQIFSVPQYLIIIRHGEKPEDHKTNGNLTAAGQRRAHAIPYLFCEAPFKTKYGEIAKVFAPNPTLQHISRRPLETAMPTAAHLGMEVQHKYTLEQSQEFITHIMTDSFLNNKTVFVAYEHSRIIALIKSFCAYKDKNVAISTSATALDKLPQYWPQSVYDWICIIKFIPGKIVDGVQQYTISYEQLLQKCMFGDSTTIKKSALVKHPKKEKAPKPQKVSKSDATKKAHNAD